MSGGGKNKRGGRGGGCKRGGRKCEGRRGGSKRRGRGDGAAVVLPATTRGRAAIGSRNRGNIVVGLGGALAYGLPDRGGVAVAGAGGRSRGSCSSVFVVDSRGLVLQIIVNPSCTVGEKKSGSFLHTFWSSRGVRGGGNEGGRKKEEDEGDEGGVGAGAGGGCHGCWAGSGRATKGSRRLLRWRRVGGLMASRP